MNQQDALMDQGLKTPRAAAIAGILFSALLITIQLLLKISVPPDPMGPAKEVLSHLKTISLALNLMPFAGVAFLWFIAVLRDRLGVLEDRFFATVFLGSGLLYIAMMFVAAALSGGLINILNTGDSNLTQFGSYNLGRAEIYQATYVYGARLAGVFMISTCTILMRTRIAPRWIAILGFAMAAVLLLGVGTLDWTPLAFPVWIFLLSGYILIENLR
jgi:preprotein translocase subunit Sec61beta